MKAPTFPSLAYTLSCDLTTWPEDPNEYNKKDVVRFASFNHPMHSGFAAFFHETIGGIRPDFEEPGFKHFTLHPYMSDEINHAECFFNSCSGKIKSDWTKKDGKLLWKIHIPVNTTATVYVPAKNDGEVYEITDRSLKPQRSLNGCKIFELGSGEYSFTSEIGNK
jgi:alpha-L-rhamnosidase